MPRPLIVLATLLGLILAAPIHAAEPHRDTEHMRVYSIEGDFEWYREALEMAIVDRGIVINNVAHIGAMLARTGADVGGEALFKHAQALEFCSAGLSRQMMETDPHNIVFCPYVVAVYETVDEPGVIHLGYRRPALLEDADARQALQAVEDLLDEIVREALTF
ncbi:DUF302 domain-containing protein [Ectothiorhodospira haloalkaliphila]|uniref:DUF302 domain-containing protein n=1 Tax=Ectothiorhodospira haloalkaliphila TaxID=421628 RepID=UPI001EE8D816|nr:DUF302 domain-containing protein [Ectothiorhodospira haloalkaliphila]MCG5525478.1 DUF302 domain-containing protein [Ectothiorhodospira haloalkaliphila]